MKSHIEPHHAKFLSGLSLYALAIALVGVAALKDYRYGLAGLFILNAITFAVWLWHHVKPKTIVTIALIAAITGAPIRQRAQEPPPGEDAVAIACGVLIVGGIIVWGIWKICKMLPPPNPPPKTNAPPAGGRTNQAPRISSVMPALLLPDFSAYNAPGWQTAAFGFQSSADGANWDEDYAITNWLCENLLISVCSSNGVALLTNVIPMSWTNEQVVCDFSSVMVSAMTDKSRFWRSVQK